MATIKRAGWPLGDDVTCAICDTQWTIEIGDAASILVDPIAGTIAVDAGCPGCDTLYTATKTIGSYKIPVWSMSERQPGHV